MSNDFLFFHGFCSSLSVLQPSVHTDRGFGKQKVDRRGQGGRGVEKWQK